MVKLFVSYRRQDSAQVTGRIYDKLVTRFGAKDVFKDVDSIPLGTDFRKILEKSIVNCDVVIVVMGLKWSGAIDPQGQPRLNDPSDYVRIEIESALKRNLPIIPLLVDEANMPAAEALPDSMRDLVFRNATRIRPDPDFHRDMDRVIDAIGQHEPMTVIALHEPRKDSAHKRRPVHAAEVLEVVPVASPPSRPPIVPRSRWSRLHNAIAAAVCSGSLAIVWALLESASDGSHLSLGARIVASLMCGVLFGLPGAVGGAIAKSVWAWLFVLGCTLLIGSAGFVSSSREISAAPLLLACIGSSIGWLVVATVAGLRAIVRRIASGSHDAGKRRSHTNETDW